MNHLHKTFIKWSVGLWNFYFRRKHESASICIWYTLILTAISTLPLSASLSFTSSFASSILPFNYYHLKVTLPYLTFLCLTSKRTASSNNFTPKTIVSDDLNNLPDHSITYMNTYMNENDKLDHKEIFFSKHSIFPCLDNLELQFSNLSQPLADHHHLIRVYHSNDSNNQRQPNSSQTTNKLNWLIKYDEDQLIYVKEFIIGSPLINSRIAIACNLFDPSYLLYCFRYVSVSRRSGQITFESDLYCLPTLEANKHLDKEQRAKQFDKQNQRNAESSVEKRNSTATNYSARYGPSLRLFSETTADKSRKLFNLNNKSNQHTQRTKHISCSCGKRTLLNFNQTSYLIQLRSGNGYCADGLLDQRDSKTLIKIRKLDFEFCFIDLTLPMWIEIKDVSLFDKKEQDLKQFSSRTFSSDHLTIRDGQTYISPQLDYFHSFPTFHYISTGLLRFESRNLGNQYTIELNHLNSKIDLLTSEHYLVSNVDEAESTDELDNRLELNETTRFLTDRKHKLNATERSLKYLTNQTGREELKSKLNQISGIRHVKLKAPKFKYARKTNEESLFVLLVDQTDQSLLVDSQMNLNEKISHFLNEIRYLNATTDYGQFLDNDLNTRIANQLRTRTFVLNLIALILFLLISVSIIIFTIILIKTQIKPPTGNLIRFGLSSETIQVNNDYQEVQSNSSIRPNLRSKLFKIDEEIIYESCKTKNSTSRPNTSDESDSQDDLLRDSEHESEIESQSVENELNDLSKRSSDEFSNAETLKNESTFFKSSFKDDFHELNKKRKMFRNCFNNCNSKDDVSTNAVGRLSQCSFPTSEISLELDYYDYLTPFVPKPPLNQ